MIRTTSAAIIILAAAGFSAPQASAQTASMSDEEAIRAVIQYYFDGGSAMRQAFLPDANMWYVRDGQLQQVPIQDFLARVEAAADRPAEESVQKRIVSIDQFGDAAVAKLEIKRPNSVITDYMSLLKVEGHWTIVNKIFAVERGSGDG